jgi:hypothetical protein
LADLDGDGIDDLMTGCFEGGAYVLPGKGKGAFGKPQKVLDMSGAILRLGQYWDDDAKKWAGVATSKFKEALGIAAVPVDWDGDGVLDLILGSQDGRMFLRRNQGTKQQWAFATESEQLMLADGRPLQVAGEHAIPAIADWDGDGLWDIVSGSNVGDVVWFKNVGKAGAPKFAAPEVLVRKDTGGIGGRTQVCVADFDGDGRPDLLIGDYHYDGGAGGKMHGYVWLCRRKPVK